MRKFSFSVLLIVAIAAATAFACDASIRVIQVNGDDWLTESIGAPPGSYVEAVIVPVEMPLVVDRQPVDPGLGLALVRFPGGHFDKYVVLRDAEGVALAYRYGGLEEFD